MDGILDFARRRLFLLNLTLLLTLILGGCLSPAETNFPQPSRTPAAPTLPAQELPTSSQESATVPGSRIELVRTYSAHDGRVLDLAFTASGAILASSGHDRHIKLWDSATGEPLGSFPMASVDMFDIDISLREDLLASGEAVWDLESGQEIFSLERGSVLPTFVAFSPDGTTLALARLDRETRLLDRNTGELIFTYPALEEKRTKRMEFSPDGTLLAEGVIDGSIRIWDAAEGELVQTLHYSAETDIHDIGISPDGRYLAQVGRVPLVIVWDLHTGQVIQRFRTRDNMYGVAFSADSRILAASAGAEKAVLLWDLESGDSLGPQPLSDQSMALTFSPDGRYLAAGTFDGQIYLWEIGQGR